MIQTDSDGNMMINIIINGNPTTVYLHAAENRDCFELGYSDLPDSFILCAWFYYKSTYKTLEDAVRQYIKALNAYYSEEE